ncbi:MAG TPA: tetratricopeptide repeat protein [Methylocella sp.]|nr:tetratricopeptide repeat protein [Methylocella sp.]
MFAAGNEPASIGGHAISTPPTPILSTAELLTNAIEHLGSTRFGEAEAAYAEVLRREPDNFLARHHLGLIAHQKGDHVSAVEQIEEALAIKPDYVEALSNLGAVQRALGNLEAALDATGRAFAIAPGFAQAYSNHGNALEDQGLLEAALIYYRKAISLNPNFVEANLNCANVLRKLNLSDEAADICKTTVSRRPDSADAYLTYGNILRELGEIDKAAEAFQRAFRLRPGFTEAYINLGNLLLAKADFQEALDIFQRALTLNPSLAEAHAAKGAALEGLGRLKEAIHSYQSAVQLNPDLLTVRTWLHHKRRMICDWDGITDEEIKLRERMAASAEAVHPFPTLSMSLTSLEHLNIAHNFAKTFTYPAFIHQRQSRARRQRLKVGYVSADFCRHATALLMVELFERHDKSRFETFAYSHGPDDRSELSIRLRNAFDHFIDLRGLTDAKAAQLIKEREIDILIELKGYTKDARTGIAARRPAPIQVSFIGFPGTLGADFIDYIIADPIVLPLDQQSSYREKIVHLPNCYQPNDTKRIISSLAPTRSGNGLPEDGFVFCSFNNSYKITPEIFDVWMRLLSAIPGSVLWLLDANELVKDNLRREAIKRGIEASRLVFAPRLASPEHLARHRLADLFLDTLPYNAHTTASDALWTGLPVLTCRGSTFAGRVAASLLEAAGVKELITDSIAAYEAVALRLARDPAYLQSLRHKLLSNIHSSPLFDIANYTRHFESALDRMWEIFANGGEPASFAVAPVATQPLKVKQKPQVARVRYLTCPLCDGSDIPAIIAADCSKHPIYHPDLPPSINWCECRSCGHVFTEGYFDTQAASIVFSKTQPNQTVGYDMERQRPTAAKMVERIARYVKSGIWLDVGFGNGSLLFTAEEWGYIPYGLDLRDENVRVLKQLGYEAHCKPIEELEYNDYFDIISMADVLEHMPFPRTGLGAAYRLLKRGGLLFLSMPNIDSMIWRLLHANKINPYWSEIEHYHNFSRKRLYDLLQKFGFHPAEYNISERHRACMEIIAIKI